MENPLNSTSLKSDLLWPRHVEKQLPPQDDDFCQPVPLMPVPVASSDLEVLCMVLVEEIVLSLQRIFTSVNAGVDQCSLPSPNPTNSPNYSYTIVNASTRLVRSSECVDWNRLANYFRVYYIWTRYSWQISIFNLQKASVKHLDPTCRRIDTKTPNWKITEPTQKKIKFRCY